MNEINFKIVCPSCEAVFEVTDPSLVGQIVACPRCGGMILIENPEQPGADAQTEQTQSDVEPQTSAKTAHEPPVQKPPVAQSPAPKQTPAPPVEPPQAPPVAQAPTAFPKINVDAPPRVAAASAESQLDENEASDNSASPWRFRLIMAIAGVVCALIVAVLTQTLFHSKSADNPADAAKSEVSAAPENGSGSDSAAADPLEESGPESDEKTADDEEETDEINLVRSEDSEASNDEFDASGAVELETEDNPATDEQNAAETESNESAETTGDENANDERGDSENADVPNEDGGEPQEQDENVETEDKSADAENHAANSDPDAPADEQADEESSEDGTDESLPTEFNEDEFDKANQGVEEAKESDDEEEEDLGAVASTTDANLQAALPTLKSEPKKIDVPLQTGLKIHAIEFPKSPAAAVRLLSEFSAVPIEFDLENFELMRASVDSTLDLSLSDVDVNGALRALCDLLKWKYDARDDRIAIEPADDVEALVEEKFDVADLLSGELPSDSSVDESAADGSEPIDVLKRAIVALVSPGSWDVNGGEGTLTSEGTTLIVKQNAVNRKRVADLLDRVRALHGLDAKGEAASETLIPETLGWERLTKTISFNLLKPVTLQQAIEIIEKTQKLGVLWDDAALNEFGAGRESTTVAGVDNATIDQVLFGMLEPLKLTYVILDENLFLITTKERAEEYKTTEIHMYAEPGVDLPEEKAAELAEEMKSSVAPKSWSEPGVALWIDTKSGCWIVRQSQPVQREIRRWTSERLVKKITEKNPDEKASR